MIYATALTTWDALEKNFLEASWLVGSILKQRAGLSAGDPWVDPQWILGGSMIKSRDPAALSLVKIGGSSETTSLIYNIKGGSTN